MSGHTEGPCLAFLVLLFMVGLEGCRRGTPLVELKVANWAGPEELEIERRNADAFERMRFKGRDESTWAA